MPRTATVIDLERLKEEINKLEFSRQFDNRGKLFEALAATSWAKIERLSASTLAAKFRHHRLTCKTPLGRRGRATGVPFANRKRVPRKTKWSGNPASRRSLAAVRRDITEMTGERHEGLLAKFEAGSAKAAIGLKCVDCCGGHQEEVKRCQITSCSLWVLRPWQEPTA